MRVRMETTMAGPTGTFLAGREAELPDAEARSLIAAGYARPVAAAVETAALAPAEETAAGPATTPRRPERMAKRGRRGGPDAAGIDESA